MAGQSIQNTGAFKFEISENTPDQEVVQLLTSIEDNQNNSWSTFYNVKVNSPNTIATELWVKMINLEMIMDESIQVKF